MQSIVLVVFFSDTSKDLEYTKFKNNSFLMNSSIIIRRVDGRFGMGFKKEPPWDGVTFPHLKH